MSDGQTITVVKDMGLVTQVFDERNLAPLDGHLAIGHVRYSTTGSSTWRNAQPVYREIGDAGLRARAQRQPHEHRRCSPSSSGCCRGCCPPTAVSTPPPTRHSSPSSSPRSGLPEPRSDGRDLEVALERVLPRSKAASRS